MSSLSTETVNDFQNSTEIYTYLRDSFKDLLQEMLEAELDSSLGYSKNDVKNKELITAGMDILKKQLKVGLEK